LVIISIKSYFKTILFCFKASLFDLFSMKTYLVFALFMPQYAFYTLKYKQQESSDHGFWVKETSLLPSENTLILIINRPEYRTGDRKSPSAVIG